MGCKMRAVLALLSGTAHGWCLAQCSRSGLYNASSDPAEDSLTSSAAQQAFQTISIFITFPYTFLILYLCIFNCVPGPSPPQPLAICAWQSDISTSAAVPSSAWAPLSPPAARPRLWIWVGSASCGARAALPAYGGVTSLHSDPRAKQFRYRIRITANIFEEFTARTSRIAKAKHI